MRLTERHDVTSEPLDPGRAPPPIAGPGVAPRLPAARLNSRDLLRDRPEVEIVHGDQLYRLRLTALGKLILTK